MWPEGHASYVMNVLIAMNAVPLLFVCFRGLPGVGYSVDIDVRDLKVAALAILVFW